MFIKKITAFVLLSFQFLAFMGAFVLLHPINATIAVSQDQETIQSEDLSEHNEQEIIVMGSGSYGTNPVTGRVRIITNRKQLSTVIEGDIVVAPAINSFWYSGLSMASAIITEKNDNNALALGKKLNIPVITGASGATKKMVDNEIVMCDPLTRNIYHVSYPTPQDVYFDTLPISHRKNHQNLYQKLGKEDKASQLQVPEKATDAEATDCFMHPNERKISTLQSGLGYKPKCITKDFYRAHFSQFKKFVLSETSKFQSTKSWFGMGAVEMGARTIGGCDDFAVECICVGEEFFSSPDAYVDKVLQYIGRSDEYIQYMDELIEECKDKPGNLNNVARKAHKKLVESTVAADVKKEDLIEHPKEYKKFADAHKIDKEKQKKLIGAGLFARYCAKHRVVR
jgi:phosphohistidine swiveling domain-containing protein